MRSITIIIVFTLLATAASAQGKLPFIKSNVLATRIQDGRRSTPAAVFDKKYQAAHGGKTFVEIPEVYELVNVAIAMTPTGIQDKNLVYQHSEYYARMRRWFDEHRDHPLLAVLDSALKKDGPYSYFSMKMNGYAFEFDEEDRIVQSKVYDRTGFVGERSNSLRPYLARLQSFADESNCAVR